MPEPIFEPVPIAVPSSNNADIDYVGDVDTYSIFLFGGLSYDFDVLGGAETAGNGDGVFDPTLTLTGPGIVGEVSDDDGGNATNSHVDLTVPWWGTGWYTLAVEGYSSPFYNETGNYTLNTSYDDGIV
jgi:hypothetical protein